MFVIGNLLSAVATILDILLQSLLVVIFINAVLSWVRPDRISLPMTSTQAVEASLIFDLPYAPPYNPGMPHPRASA